MQKEIISQSLERSWEELDEICYEIYEVTDEEKRLIQAVGRTVNRVELLNGVN